MGLLAGLGFLGNSLCLATGNPGISSTSHLDASAVRRQTLQDERDWRLEG